MVLFWYFPRYLEQYLVLTKYRFSVDYSNTPYPRLPVKQLKMYGAIFAYHNDQWAPLAFGRLEPGVLHFLYTSLQYYPIQ